MLNRKKRMLLCLWGDIWRHETK